MGTPQYAIMRFAKYKGPEISKIDAHNERTKESYKSNPDIDHSRTHLNFHLVTPERRYRVEAERQIKEANCRTRTDSVRVVEVLIAASPDFFKEKTQAEVKAFFQHALTFIQKNQSPETIISAAVHMDEETPHMHLSFVPLTADKRLTAKEILGNRKKMIWWQDEYWKHMHEKYPVLERGESASETGRNHIPTRLFKEAVHLNRQKALLLSLISEVNPLNKARKSAEIEALLERYIPSVEKMRTQLKRYDSAFKTLKAEKAELEHEVNASKESVVKRLELMQRLNDYEELRRTVEAIPPEIMREYAAHGKAKSVARKQEEKQ